MSSYAEIHPTICRNTLIEAASQISIRWASWVFFPVHRSFAFWLFTCQWTMDHWYAYYLIKILTAQSFIELGKWIEYVVHYFIIARGRSIWFICAVVCTESVIFGIIQSHKSMSSICDFPHCKMQKTPKDWTTIIVSYSLNNVKWMSQFEHVMKVSHEPVVGSRFAPKSIVCGTKQQRWGN